MYSFGKEIRDLREAERLTMDLIKSGEFNDFLDETGIDKDFVINNIEVAECFTLGIDYDICLEDCFDTNTQQSIIDEIKKRESYADNSLIVGNCALYLENIDEMLFGYFLCSNVFSKTNNDKMLLLAVGFALGEDIVNATKQFVTL